MISFYRKNDLEKSNYSDYHGGLDKEVFDVFGVVAVILPDHLKEAFELLLKILGVRAQSRVDLLHPPVPDARLQKFLRLRPGDPAEHAEHVQYR